MYTHITNPDTNMQVPIHSKQGQEILNFYIMMLKGNLMAETHQKGGSKKSNEMNLVYMAKPGYGGWVSFTAHLALTYGAKLFKIGNTTEKKTRPYGYGVEYKNTIADEVVEMPNLLITAIDKNYYQHLDKFQMEL